jgi:hypothetical protein
MQTLTDALFVLFLALGSAWFAVDLVRKLRQPAPGHAEPRLGKLAPAAAAARAPAAESPAPAPAPLEPTPPPSAPLATPAPLALAAPPPPEADGILLPHLAAITAAVHHLFRGQARLAGVFPASSQAAFPQIDWAREGRRDIFTSHRVR